MLRIIAFTKAFSYLDKLRKLGRNVSIQQLDTDNRPRVPIDMLEILNMEKAINVRGRSNEEGHFTLGRC